MTGLTASLSIEKDCTVEVMGPQIEAEPLISDGSMRLSSINSDVSRDDGNSIIDCDGVENSVQDVEEEALILDCVGLCAIGAFIPMDI